MDAEKCRALLVVLEEGGIHKAAQRLGYTPSGVSRMMTSLESEIGFSLLIRGKQGVRPTTACEDMLPYLKQLVTASRACDEAALNIRGLRTGSIRIGTEYPEYYPQLTQIMAAFRELYPGVRLSIREGLSTELAEAVENAEVDLAIISKRSGSFEWHGLYEDELVAIVPPDHECAGKGAYPIERFSEDPYIEIGTGDHSDNHAVFAAHGIRPNLVASVVSGIAGYAMVGAGLGVSLNNLLHVRQRHGAAVALPLEPCVKVELGAAISPTLTPAASAFIGFALDRFGDPASS